MHSSTNMKKWLLHLVLLFLILPIKGESETGIAGTGIGYLPEPNGDGNGGHGVEGGGADEHDPEVVIEKALECFGDKHIYNSCEESYRLTESGQLHVPPGYTDEYCSGPCLKETHHVLDCIDDMLSKYVFYNHATIEDVKETIKEGCSYGPHRGDFNVAEHIEGDEGNAYKLSFSMLFGLPSLVLVINLLY